MDTRLNSASTSENEEELWQIASTTDDSLVRNILAGNPHISIRIIKCLAPYCLQELMRNPALTNNTNIFPNDVIEVFEEHAAQIPKLQISENSGWFEYLLEHPSDRVRNAAASNPFMSIGLQEKYCLSEDIAVKLGLSINPSLGSEVLRVLGLDCSDRVRSAAQNRISSLEYAPTNFDYANPNTFTSLNSPTKVNFNYEPTSLGSRDKLHPMVLISVLLGLLCFGLFLIAIPAKKTVNGVESISSLSPRGKVEGAIPPTGLSTNAETAFTKAIDYANRATLVSKTANSKDEWLVVVNTWNMAIAELNKIDSQSQLYSGAQEKIGQYRTILQLAEKRLNSQ